MPTYKVNYMLCGHPGMSKWEQCDDVQTAIEWTRMFVHLNHEGDTITSIVQVKRGRNNEVIVPPESYPHGPFELDPVLEARRKQIVQRELARANAQLFKENP